MRFNHQKLTISLTLSLLLCVSQLVWARPQSGGNPVTRGIGGLVGAASGAIAGGVAGANAGVKAADSDGNSSISASSGASQSIDGGSGGGSASLSANANLSGSSSSGGGLSASGSASLDAGSSGGSSLPSSLSSQAAIMIGTSTPKPEGLIDKVKDMFKDGKEIIKSSVDSLTKDDKKDEKKLSAEASLSGGSGGGGSSSGSQISGGASLNLSGGGSSGSGSGSISSGGGSGGGGSIGGSLSANAQMSGSQGSGSGSASASLSIGSTTQKPGFLDKLAKIAEISKDTIKDVMDPRKDSSGSSSSSNGGGSGGGASLSANAQMSGSQGSGSGSASASLTIGSTTQKPSFLDKLSKLEMSKIAEKSKESGKDSMDMRREGGSGSSSSSSGGGASLSANAQFSGSQSSGSGSGSASASLSIGSTTQRPGFFDKMSKMVEKSKESGRDSMDLRREGSGSGGSISGSFSGSSSSGASSDREGGMSLNANANLSIGKKDELRLKFDERREERKEGPIDKVQKLVSKGTDAVRETVHNLEDRANIIGEKVSKAIDDNVRKPMQSVSGSGTQTSEGQLSLRAQAAAQLRGADRERHLIEVKKDQEAKLSRPSSLKQVVTEAKAKGVIPQSEDRSVLRGNHADEKSVAVEVFDKAHEMSKIPVESVLKPIDKMLGYEKDPLMRIYDNSHEILRRPLSLVSKPVESVLNGAFKTTEEAKKESERLLATTSEQERREARLREEKARKEDRSVVGSIADKTMELATKPIEIVLKPFDHVLGYDKDGKKNPLLRAIDEIYSLSKKPIDAIAKPFESILKKMGDGEQLYQVSIRFNQDNADPKLVTRLADGALNVADRVLIKPLEIVMKPLNHALGYDEPGKKNPIVEAAHQLKNATKVGVELVTKPIDRIIKEIADIGEHKSDAEREADYERSKQEASRIVKALDKLHEAAQFPFEIVLKPIGKVLGTNKGNRKDPLLRAWDIVHQVVRTPIQVISKPWEEALLGESAKKQNNGGQFNVQAKAAANGGQANGRAGAKATIGGKIGPIKAGASIQINGGANRNQNNNNGNENKKNVITESIKKVEKLASKPIEVITSPIRKMILGEDNEKLGSETDKNNRAIQAKAGVSIQGGSAQTSAQIKASGGGGSSSGSKQPDKILKTLEKVNNVILKPLEEITQPISDVLSSDKKIEIKGQISGQKQQSQQQQQQPRQISASAQAQIKKN